MDDEPEPLLVLFVQTLTKSQGGDWPFYVGSLMALALFLTGSALISGSEAAFFSLSPQDIKKCQKSTANKDQRILKLLKRSDELLATILVLNNLLNISFVILATYVCWRLVGTNQLAGSALVLLTAGATTCIVLFGEIIPKIYANLHPLAYARRVALSLHALNTLLLPFTGLFRWIHHFIRRRIPRIGLNYSTSTLKEALDIASQGDHTSDEKDMLEGIMNLSSMQVQEVMQARMDIIGIEKNTPLSTLFRRINTSGFSRFPVYKESIDHIEGMLYTKDLLPYVDKNDEFRWQRLIREPYFVPEGRKIGDLFKDFQRERTHMAIVVDEYGGTSGLVTMEDVIEEIVGDIEDESDVAIRNNYKKLSDKVYEFEAKVSLNELSKVLDLPSMFFNEGRGESNSLGGLILELKGQLPAQGQEMTYKTLRFKIQSVDRKRIGRVRIEIGA